MDLRDTVATVFYLARGRVEGLVRLQLMMYILHRETHLVNAHFETWYAVPWSGEVERAVEELVRDGLLSVERDGTTGLETYIASGLLMERGAETYKKIEERDPYVARITKLIVVYVASLPLSKSILAVKVMYPETAQHGTSWFRLLCDACKA